MRRHLGTTSVLLLTALLAASNVSAQYEQGRRFAGPHIGLPGTGSGGIAIGGAFEQGFTKNIGIGAFVDYWTFGAGTIDYTYVAFGGMGSYHFVMKETKWDPFAGVSLGYYNVGVDEDLCGGFDCDASRIFVGGQAGVRYFFKPALAGVARVGVGAAYLTGGVEWKF